MSAQLLTLNLDKKGSFRMAYAKNIKGRPWTECEFMSALEGVFSHGADEIHMSWDSTACY